MSFQISSDFPFRMYVCGHSLGAGCGSQKFQREGFITNDIGECENYDEIGKVKKRIYKIGMFVVSEKKVYMSDCINIVRMKDSVFCYCGIWIGLLDIVDEKEIVTFSNVREVLFQPYVSYTRNRGFNGKDKRSVLFTEVVESGKCSVNNALDVSKILIHPIAEVEAEDRTQETETIRVAAITSGDFITVNESRVMGYFKKAILQSHSEQESASSSSDTPINDGNLQGESTSDFNSRSDRLQGLGLNEYLIFKNTVEDEANCN